MTVFCNLPADMLRSERTLHANIRNKITVLSSVFSIGIVLYHSNPAYSFSQIAGTSKFLFFINRFCDSLGGIAVSFFFLVSAFLLYYNLRYENLLAKLQRRVHTLAVPFLLWNGIMYLLRGYYRTGTDRFYLNVLISKYAGGFWFVGALMLLLLATPICLTIFRNRYVGAGLVAAVYALALANWFHVADWFPEGAHVDRFLYYLPAYFTGVYLGLHGFSIVNTERYGLGAIIALLLLVSSYAFSVPIVSTILVLLRAVFLWMILPSRLFVHRPKWWQQLSFYTYATHICILEKIKELIMRWNIGSFDYITISIEGALLWRFALTAVACIIIIISARLLIRFAPKLYATLTGGRVPNIGTPAPAAKES